MKAGLKILSRTGDGASERLAAGRVLIILLRRLGKVLLALLLLMIVLLVVVALFNRYSDEQLDPGVLALAPTLPAEKDNAAFEVFGMRAAAGADARSVGLAYWRRVERLSRGNEDLPEPPQDLLTPDLPPCPAEQFRCLQWLSLQVDVDALTQQHAVLLQRYRELHARPTLAAPYLQHRSFDGPYPLLPMKVQRLWLQQALHRWNEGDMASLADIQADVRFWRQSAVDASYLIDKVIAVAALENDYRWLAEAALSRPQQFRTHRGAWEGMLAPLPAAYFDFRRIVRGEFNGQFQHYRQMATHGLPPAEDMHEPDAAARALRHLGGRWLMHWFFQPNATQNALLRRLPAVDALLSARPSTFVTYRGPEFYDADCNEMHWHLLKNPVGKLLLCETADLTPYFLRLHRVEALRRLVLLQSRMLASGQKSSAPAVPMSMRNPLHGELPRLEREGLQFDWPDGYGKDVAVRVGLP